MSAVLAEVGRGFAQPVAGAQQVFRSVLEAMARPGRVQALDATALAGMDDAGLGRARCAVLLALLDAETRVWLHPGLAQAGARAHLQFHTGVRIAPDAEGAAFVVADAGAVDAAWWERLPRGSDAAPQDGATLVVEVPALERGPALALRGPGIERVQRLQVDGLRAGFWQARVALEREFPLGVELILTCGDRLAALPRSTRVTLEG